MERFRYIALDASGEVRHGELWAGDRGEAAATLESQQFRPVRLDAAGGFRLGDLLNREIALRPGLSRTEQALFMRSMASLLDAGMPVDLALRTVADLQRRAKARELVADMRQRVKAGASLSSALASEAGLFSAEIVAMVRAGEESGNLGEVLTEIGEYLERSDFLRAKVRSAMYYPAFLLTMALAAIIIVVTLVLPQFEPLFRSAGADLPLVTRWVRAFGLFIVDYYWLLIALVLLSIATVAIMRRNLQGRLRLGKAILSLPVVGRISASVNAARFARVLGAQLRGGVGMARALEISRNVLANAVLSAEVDRLGETVRKGSTLAAALQTGKHFPHTLVQLARVGEEAGQLDQMLLRVARIYDQQVALQLDRLVALMVPVITLVMGLVVGVIVFSVLAAILSLNQLI